MVTSWGSYDKPIIPMASMMLVSAVVFLLINPARPLLPTVTGPAEEQPACV
jgi:hypothetical protein